jgi:hypothetical protein
VRFTMALVMLTLFLGGGAAHALPMEGRDADRSPGLWIAAWDWLASLLQGQVPFLSAYEASETVNPPLPQDTTNTGSGGGDHGGFIDPNGDPHS